MLVAALLEAGFSQVTRRCVPDTEGIITEAIYKALLESDAIILTGGISAGLHDYVPDALAGVGATILYRGIAMKPGKPQLFAKSATGQPVFGLPGNPMSSIVGLYELVLPALKRMSGCPVDHCRPSLYFPLAEAVRNSAERVQLAPAIIETGPAGTQVRPLKSAGSADLVTGSKADGAILLPAAVGSLPAGEIVQFRPWGGVGA